MPLFFLVIKKERILNDMNIMKTYKISMSMSYAKYDDLLTGPEGVHYAAILDKFVKDMFNGPREEIIKFFGLDEDDAKELDDNKFMIGYKIKSDDTENRVLYVIVLLNVVLTDQPDGMPEGMEDIDDTPLEYVNYHNHNNNSDDDSIDKPILVEDTNGNITKLGPDEKLDPDSYKPRFPIDQYLDDNNNTSEDSAEESVETEVDDSDDTDEDTDKEESIEE